TRADIEGLVRGDPTSRLLSGWRAEVAGEPVRRLLEGRAALAFDGEGSLVIEARSHRPVAVDRDGSDDGAAARRRSRRPAPRGTASSGRRAQQDGAVGPDLAGEGLALALAVARHEHRARQVDPGRLGAHVDHDDPVVAVAGRTGPAPGDEVA